MNHQNYLNICRILINIERDKTPEQPLTVELIRKVVEDTVSKFDLGGDDSDAMVEAMVRDLELVYSTWIDQPMTLTDGTHKPWLPKKIASINWQYWNRYRTYLLEKGWANETVNRLDETTRDILGFMEDPQRNDPWDIRGMVVGHVQSGKTANYSGLVCRAIDSGYKVIVILAGTLNNLRSQTQIRLDESVLGFNSVHNLSRAQRIPIGVGRIGQCTPLIDTITTRDENGDFKTQVANQFSINPGGNPLLFIIKKNGNILRNLIEWVEWASHSHGTEGGKPIIRNVPLLVIDDEADYGSVDTRRQFRNNLGQIDEEHDPTLINKRIRQLLFYFEKSCYVGYTATPFANIFIHPQNRLPQFGEDLFPRNFIMCLPTPSDHFGPKQVFGIAGNHESDMLEEDGLPIIRDVDDSEEWIPPRHKNYHCPIYKNEEAIPPSLKNAIKSFILATAIRYSRGQVKTHNSMLIHVSRFVSLQTSVYNQVNNYLSEIRNRIQYGDGGRESSIFDEIKILFNMDFVKTSREIYPNEERLSSWDMISPHIKTIVLSTKVKQINGSTGDVLDYIENSEIGLNVIAIGGDKLSRGLTLEGLTVSYFLRNSYMYDTLMQMGRWFGYRNGYVDVCRLFLPKDLREWFRHITLASEELRMEFAYMVATGGKPSDFGLKVRSHPTLLVTAPVKMREGTELGISFSGSICETVVFHKSESFLRNNLRATIGLLCRISEKAKPSVDPRLVFSDNKTRNWTGLCWQGVDFSAVCRFLREYNTHEDARKVNARLLAQYIETMSSNPTGDLQKWTVFMPSSSLSTKTFNLPDPINLSPKMMYRAWHKDFDPEKNGYQDSYHIRRLISPIDECVDIDEVAWKKALTLTQTLRALNHSLNSTRDIPEEPSGRSIRDVRDRKTGLLMIYPLEPDSSKSDIVGEDIPIIGIALSFPGNLSDEKVTYVVNKVYRDQEIGDME